MLKRFSLAVLFVCFASEIIAAPRHYTLIRNQSQIAFSFDLQGSALVGNIPIEFAEVSIDFERLTRSRIRVQFAMADATAGVIFATQAMRSASVLATDQYPVALFESTQVQRSEVGASLTGDLTLRGITRPVVLDTRIYRARGSEPGDLSELVLLLTGAIDRNDFGAIGYANLVAPKVDLRILVNLQRN